MTFFQDNNLEKMEIINHYNALIAQGKYSDASDYISQREGVYGFFADFFNLIENRIYNLQEYLLNKPAKKQPFIYYDDEEYFSIGDIHVFFNVEKQDDSLTSDAPVFIETEEDLSSIVLFSDNDEQEALDNLYIFAGEQVEPPDADEDTIWI